MFCCVFLLGCLYKHVARFVFMCLFSSDLDMMFKKKQSNNLEQCILYQLLCVKGVESARWCLHLATPLGVKALQTHLASPMGGVSYKGLHLLPLSYALHAYMHGVFWVRCSRQVLWFLLGVSLFLLFKERQEYQNKGSSTYSCVFLFKNRLIWEKQNSLHQKERTV